MSTVTIACKNIIKFFQNGGEKIEVLKNVDVTAQCGSQ